jgi:hypothetical protein
MYVRAHIARCPRIGLITLLGIAFLAASLMTSTAQGSSAPCAAGSPSASTAATKAPAPTSTALPAETAVATEDNPPGDIPDNQAFVTYRSAVGGYSVSMPEGWARKEDGPNVSFVDKLHSFTVEISCSDTAPTIDSINSIEVPL